MKSKFQKLKEDIIKALEDKPIIGYSLDNVYMDEMAYIQLN